MSHACISTLDWPVYYGGVARTHVVVVLVIMIYRLVSFMDYYIAFVILLSASRQTACRAFHEHHYSITKSPKYFLVARA